MEPEVVASFDPEDYADPDAKENSKPDSPSKLEEVRDGVPVRVRFSSDGEDWLRLEPLFGGIPQVTRVASVGVVEPGEAYSWSCSLLELETIWWEGSTDLDLPLE